MLFIRGSWIPGMSSRRKTKYVRGNAFLHTTKNSSHTSHTPTWHSRKRVEQSKVLIRGNGILSKPKNLSEKSWEKVYIRRFLTASRVMKNFTQASLNITSGQKKGQFFFYNGTIDITHNVSPEQRDRYAAFYNFRYHPNFLREALWKVVQTIMKLRGQLSAWTQRRVRIHRSLQEEINAAMIWILKNSNGWFGCHTIGRGTLQSTSTQM